MSLLLEKQTQQRVMLKHHCSEQMLIGDFLDVFSLRPLYILKRVWNLKKKKSIWVLYSTYNKWF